MSKRLTVSDLEAMTIHELSDLLADMVRVLRRLPDVPVSDLLDQPEVPSAEKLLARFRRGKGADESTSLPDWLEKQ